MNYILYFYLGEGIQGVQNVKNIEIINKVGESLGYSKYAYEYKRGYSR